MTLGFLLEIDMDWWASIIGKKQEYVSDDYKPTMQDKFYHPAHGSGWVVWIDYTEKTVRVGYADHHRAVYSWHQIEDKYSDRYGGIWIMDS